MNLALARERLSLPEEVSGRPIWRETSSIRQSTPTVSLTAWRMLPIRPSRLGHLADEALHQHDDFLAQRRLGREGAGIAAAQPRQRLDRPFDVLRPDVAAVDDDQVLGAAGDHQLAVAPVAEVAGVEPAVVQDPRAGVGLPEIARHDAGPVDEEPADTARPASSTAPSSSRISMT